jgi:hypothetical protein
MTIENNFRKLIQRYPRSFAIIIGIFLLMSFLLMAESILKFYNFCAGKDSFVARGKVRCIYDELLGYKPKADSKLVATFISDKELMYKATYSIDQYNRRITPIENRKKRNKFVVFFGCSFAFGEGLQDNETIPFYFANLADTYMPYNYAFSGYGPQQMLAKVQDKNIANEIAEPNGIGFYVYNAWHIPRAAGFMSVYNSWGKDMPYYFLDENKMLIHDGNFTTGRPVLSLFYRILGLSGIAKLFKIEFPFKITEEHIQLTNEIIRAAQQAFKEKFKQSEFYVVFHPLNTGNIQNIKSFLDSNRIRYLDYADLFKNIEDNGLLTIPDGHPSAYTNKLIAEHIAEDLFHKN